MSEVLGEGRYIRLCARDGWEWCERVNASGIVVIVAVTPDNELLLVEQFRKPVGARVIELPAGLAGDHDDPDEDLAIAASRELEEETGWVAEALEPLTRGPVSAGMTTEVLTWFRAHGLRRVGAGGGDASEDIVVHRVALDEVAAFVAERARRGVMTDPKVFAGLYFATS